MAGTTLFRGEKRHLGRKRQHREGGQRKPFDFTSNIGIFPQ
jgi:hypothetical protein